jgi:hypothetical protein
MAGGVDHIDLHALVDNADIFRKDRDAAFALEVVAVEHAHLHIFVIAKEMRLFDDLVDKCGFAVVDVRDNRDIPDFLTHGVFSAIKNEPRTYSFPFKKQPLAVPMIGSRKPPVSSAWKTLFPMIGKRAVFRSPLAAEYRA